MTSENSSRTLVFLGTYTWMPPGGHGRGNGIYVYEFDRESGTLTLLQETPNVENPSFVAISPDRRFLYAVNELQTLDGQASGGVSAFTVDPSTGALSFLNRQLALGTDPCYVSIDDQGRYVFVANYTSGSVTMFPILSDGQLGAPSDHVQHVGSSIMPRQTSPHAHSIKLDPANRFALVPDLGKDQVVVYRPDFEKGKLVLNDTVGPKLAPGSGPRHLAYHPNGQYVYVINELSSTITAFNYDAHKGTLDEIETVSALPEDYTGANGCAEIVIHPSGDFVYGSNRGHDSIAVFGVDTTGRLTPIEHVSTEGQTPRNFAIDPSGRYLFAENQDSDSIVTFRINHETGGLIPTGQVISVPSPVCMIFVDMGLTPRRVRTESL